MKPLDKKNLVNSNKEDIAKKIVDSSPINEKINQNINHITTPLSQASDTLENAKKTYPTSVESLLNMQISPMKNYLSL